MKKFIGIATIILFFSACAKDAPNPTDGLDDITYRSWITKNAPKAKLVESDVYIEFIERSGINPDLKPSADSSWLEISYVGKKFDGTVFVTRNEYLSRQVNTWLATTHWSDEFTAINVYNRTLNVALVRGMMEMREGDSARIYIPGKFVSSDYINPGYQGETTNFAASPVYFDVRLKRIINKPVEYEAKKVDTYAEMIWNQMTEDSIVKGVYYRIITEFPDADTLAKTESIGYDYTEYFLDGFIIKTTLDSIAKEAGVYNSQTSYISETVFMNSENPEGISKLFINVLPKMKKGEEAEVICTSDWTVNGVQGSISNTPQIDPYTPRLFKLRVHPADTTEKEK